MIIAGILAFLGFCGIVLPIFVKWGTKIKADPEDFIILLGAILLLVSTYYFKNN